MHIIYQLSPHLFEHSYMGIPFPPLILSNNIFPLSTTPALPLVTTEQSFKILHSVIATALQPKPIR